MALVMVSIIIFWTPLSIVLHYPIWTNDAYDKYCYTVIVPFLSVSLLYFDRRSIFLNARYGLRAGTLLLLTGLLSRLIAGQFPSRIGVGNSLSIEFLGLVAFWIGAFILCYGTSTFRAGAFPLLLLFLTVPVPDFLLDKLIVTAQYGSAEVSSLIFGLSRVPVLRNGLVFYLPDISIRVEKECSGIHSTMAILLVSLIAAHLFLASRWKKILLVLLAIPIVCVTNGLRIAVLTLLAQYVNRSFLFGRLHHQGGVVFFSLALLLLYATLRLMRIRTPQPQSHAVVLPQKPT
jgi:exosortase